MGNFEGMQKMEPFCHGPGHSDKRKNTNCKWKCTCDYCLKCGHCRHVFVLTHGKSDLVGEGFHDVAIPPAAVLDDLSDKRKRGRPSAMAPALLNMTQTEGE